MPHNPSQTSVQHHMNFNNIGFQPRGTNYNFSNVYNNSPVSANNYHHNPYSNFNGSSSNGSYGHNHGYNHNDHSHNNNNFYSSNRGNSRMKNGPPKPYYPKNSRHYDYHYSRKSNSSPFPQIHHRQQHDYNLSYQPYGGYQPLPPHQIMPQMTHMPPQQYMDDQLLADDSLSHHQPILFNPALPHIPHPSVGQSPEPLISNESIIQQPSHNYPHRFNSRSEAPPNGLHPISPEIPSESFPSQFVQTGGTFSSKLPWLSVSDQSFPKRQYIRKHRVEEKLKLQLDRERSQKQLEEKELGNVEQLELEAGDDTDKSKESASPTQSKEPAIKVLDEPINPSESPIPSLAKPLESPKPSPQIASFTTATTPPPAAAAAAVSQSATKSWAEKLKTSPSKPVTVSPKKPDGTKPVSPVASELSKSSKSPTTNGAAAQTHAVSEPKGSAQKSPVGVVLAAFDYEHVRKSYGQNKIARGMANSGNICFMNSILQVLMHCPPFYKFLAYAEKNSIFQIKSETPLMDAMVELSRELNKTSAREQSSLESSVTEINNQPVSPEAFYGVMRSQPAFKHYKRGRQEDAEEFLGYLLETLHDEFLAAMKTSASLVETKKEDADEQGSDWLEVGKNHKGVTVQHNAGFGKTPISQLFAGNLRSTLHVPSKKPSITREPFQQIQLDISDPDVDSIEDAFVNLTKPEKLQFSTSTQQEVRATKQILIDDAPEILVAHLKRFSYTVDDKKEYPNVQEQVRKISKPITYPSHLQLPQESVTAAVSTPEPPSYTLCGVIYHHGPSATSGHYTADVKIFGDDGTEEWINIDDISLNKIAAPNDLAPSKGQRSNNSLAGAPTMASVLSSKPVNGQSKGRGKPRELGEPVAATESTKTAYILFYTKNRAGDAGVPGTHVRD